MKIEALGFFIANCLPLQEAQTECTFTVHVSLKRSPFPCLFFVVPTFHYLKNPTKSHKE